MGGLVSSNKQEIPQAAEKSEEEKEAEKKARESRRRNSLALSISKFIKFEGDDYQELVEEIKAHKDSQNPVRGKVVREDKWSKTAKSVLQGNFRELRNQVVLHFGLINRKYRDEWVAYSMLHFVCQEGYATMLEFALDPKSHSEFDENEIEIDIRNARNRTPMMLCFTPPTGTYVGLQNGLNDDLVPLAEQPEDVEVLSDWIRPGGPAARERCIELLLNYGANPNIKDAHDYSYLHYSAMWGWADAATHLIKAGGDINAVNSAGKTPLHIAIEYQNVEFVSRILESAELMIEATDSEGNTGLLLAIEGGDDFYEIAQIMLKGGSNPNAFNHRQRSCLLSACKQNSLALVNLLLNWKCQRDKKAFEVLSGDVKEAVNKRLDLEDKMAREAAEKAAALKEKAILEGNYDEAAAGYRNKTPWGAWVEYNDKRGGGIFYYNPVTRDSQWDKPKDFKKNAKREIKDAIFGLHFYH